MDFTKCFFHNKWVPDSNTIKTSQYSDNFFLIADRAHDVRR